MVRKAQPFDTVIYRNGNIFFFRIPRMAAADGMRVQICDHNNIFPSLFFFNIAKPPQKSKPDGLGPSGHFL